MAHQRMIYLAAGCPSSSEIIMRSTGVHNLNEMNDNTDIWIIDSYGESAPGAEVASHFGLTVDDIVKKIKKVYSKG